MAEAFHLGSCQEAGLAGRVEISCNATTTGTLCCCIEVHKMTMSMRSSLWRLTHSGLHEKAARILSFAGAPVFRPRFLQNHGDENHLVVQAVRPEKSRAEESIEF